MYSASYRSDSRKSSIIHYAFFFKPKLSSTLTRFDIHHVKTFIVSKLEISLILLLSFRLFFSRFVRSFVRPFLFYVSLFHASSLHMFVSSFSTQLWREEKRRWDELRQRIT